MLIVCEDSDVQFWADSESSSESSDEFTDQVRKRHTDLLCTF